MAQELQFGRDAQGYNAFSPYPSENVLSATLQNGVDSPFELPAEVEAWVVSFSFQPGTSVWVDFSGTTAAIPAGASLVASTSELNPGSRVLKTFENDGVTKKSYSVITANTTADMSVSFYAVKFAN